MCRLTRSDVPRMVCAHEATCRSDPALSIQQLWLHYLDWWDDHDQPPADEAAYDDLEARREVYVEAIQRMRDTRTQPLGGRQQMAV